MMTKGQCYFEIVSFSDPSEWSAQDVKAWLVFNLQQFGQDMAAIEYFNMTGSVLAQLTEADFQQRAPQVRPSIRIQ